MPWEFFNLTEIFSLVAGAVIGWLTSWIFEKRAAKEDKARHELTLAHNKALMESNEDLQARIRELEQSQRSLQNRVSEGFASSARPNELHTGSTVVALTPEGVVHELRSRVDVEGKAPVWMLRSAFLARGHSAAQFDDTIDQLARSGVIRVEGKAIELL